MVVAVLASGLLAGAAGTAGAADGPGADDPEHPGVVGGDESPPGAWPSQAALVFAGNPNNAAAQFCGATVLSRTWVLSAAHCVDDLLPSEVNVLVETQDLAVGGRRVGTVELRRAPGWSRATFQNDVVLLRLRDPVWAPGQVLTAPGAPLAAGTDAITIGWGATSAGGAYPTRLREVHVPVISDPACEQAYPDSPRFDRRSMVCARDTTDGGVDSCNGDSGGPLLVDAGSGPVQVGIVSWGIGCADPRYPGVYTRLATYRGWIDAQIRYGPHPDASTFVRQQFLDAAHRPPTEAERAAGVWALVAGTTTPAAYAQKLVYSQVWQGRAGAVARLYLAALRRDVDQGGMVTWINRLEAGGSLDGVAGALVASREFLALHGPLTNRQYVELLYRQVLKRAGSTSEVNWWTSRLDARTSTRGQVLVAFSETSEHRARTRPRTDVTTTFFALVRRVPTAGEMARWVASPNLDLVTSLLASFTYANRF